MPIPTAFTGTSLGKIPSVGLRMYNDLTHHNVLG